MRVLVALLIAVPVVGMLTFVLLNVGQRVDVHLGFASYAGVSLAFVVAAAVAAGALCSALIALAEGLPVHFAHRRCLRRLARLEEELERARAAGGAEPTPALGEPPRTAGAPADDSAGRSPAPVYGTGRSAEEAADDDPYSGGRAV